MPKKSDSLDFCGHNLQLTIFTSVCCEFGVYKKSLLVGQKIASEDRLGRMRYKSRFAQLPTARAPLPYEL